MATRHIFVLACASVCLGLFWNGVSRGVEGAEIEPHISLPPPLAAEVESPIDVWGLPASGGPRWMISGAYLEAGGYDVFLRGNPKGTLAPSLSVHLCKGHDMGPYSVQDGTASLRSSGNAGDVALWARHHSKTRPVVSIEGGDQLGELLGGGAVCRLGSAVYTLRGSASAFYYSLDDGSGGSKSEGNLAGFSADIDVFYSERGVLSLTTRLARDSLFWEQFRGETRLAHHVLLTPFVYLTPGIAANWDFSRFYPSFEFHYIMSKRMNLHFTYQMSYWSPSLAEIYLNKDYFHLSPALRAQETSRSLEARLRLRLNELNSLRISFTQKKVGDFVFWESGDEDLLYPGNRDVDLYEVKGEIESGLGLFGNRLSLWGRRVEDVAGSPVPYEPELELREEFDINPVEGWRLTLGSVYCGERRYRRIVEDKLPGYFTSFLRGEGRMGTNVSLYLAVDNALDRRYEPFKGHTYRGRTWSGGGRLSFW